MIDQGCISVSKDFASTKLVLPEFCDLDRIAIGVSGCGKNCQIEWVFADLTKKVRCL